MVSPWRCWSLMQNGSFDRAGVEKTNLSRFRAGSWPTVVASKSLRNIIQCSGHSALWLRPIAVFRLASQSPTVVITAPLAGFILIIANNHVDIYFLPFCSRHCLAKTSRSKTDQPKIRNCQTCIDEKYRRPRAMTSGGPYSRKAIVI